MAARLKFRAINRLTKYQEYFNRLAKPLEGKTERTFTTIKDTMIFCAFLGYESGKRRPLPKNEPTEDIQEHIFSNDEGAMTNIYMLGLASEKDWSILHPDSIEKLATLFEEYANAGIEILKEWMDSNVHDISGVETIISNLRKTECIPARDVLTGPIGGSGSVEF